MAELNLNQIIEKLNKEFSGESRKLVFWYDDNGDFAGDIDSVELKNARVYRLTPTNQFRTKIFLERQDKTTNYLIYAPFPKPPVEQNHLEDTLLYSKRFYADRASLISADLGIQEKYRPVIQKYIKFFGEKKRMQRFYDLEIENFTEETIEIALMSALCQLRVASFEEVVRILLAGNANGLEIFGKGKSARSERFLGTETNQDGNMLAGSKILAEFKKYKLLDAFWKQCENNFGYVDNEPTLEKLVMTLFVTYTAKYVKTDLPQSWKPFLSYKPGNIMIFLDSLMNNVLYRDFYDKLSVYAETELSADKVFSDLSTDSFAECDTFLCVDQMIIKWLNERLLNEDTGARLDGMSIPEVCQFRRKKHFASKTGMSYTLLEAAWHLVCTVNYQSAKELKDIQEKYITADYRIDMWYRIFIHNLDQTAHIEGFEELRELVENIYTNEYLDSLLPAWNAALNLSAIREGIPQQKNFYSTRVSSAKERIVVIISDAMRFEVGKSLAEKLEQDPNSTVSMGAQLSMLPSYTALGMAALLPHRTLEMTDDYKILADGKPTDSILAREAVLKMYQPQSVCIQFDDLKHRKTVTELRSILTGKQVVYVYHNQIDARGENLRTEDEVFNACDEAIDEIVTMIHRIATSGNTYRFLVTADHGFLYKRDVLSESDKISSEASKGAFLDRRFIIDQNVVSKDGVAHISLGDIFCNDDTRQVSFPVSTSVFKVGGGMNYLHGGSSPQEVIVPILDIKMERYHMETHTVQIALISIVRKITNLITHLDFVQTEAVSDTIKSTNFRIYFISEDGERITNENIMIADSKNDDPAKRITRLRFTFKDKKYDPAKNYYLVVNDEKNGLEVFRQEIVIDIAFADGFSFRF